MHFARGRDLTAQGTEDSRQSVCVLPCFARQASSKSSSSLTSKTAILSATRLEQTGRECTIDDPTDWGVVGEAAARLCGAPRDDPPALTLPECLGEDEVQVQHGPGGELPFGFKECAVEALEVERGEVREPAPSESRERVQADQRLVALVGLRAYPPPHLPQPLDEVLTDRGGSGLLARAHNTTLALQAPFQQLRWGARTIAA